MHPSCFQLLSPADDDTPIDLSMSGEVSEWLMHVGLWDRLNARYGTDFTHYEEETLLPSMSQNAQCLVNELVDGLADSSDDELNFCYGWDRDLVPLICTVSIRTIVAELRTLIAFLEQANSRNLAVYCQL